MTNGHVTPAMIAAIQNVHRQDTVETKPDIIGPAKGPQVVAAMKSVTARPRDVGES